MLELPHHHEDCVKQLLNLWVSCLSVLQDFANKVYSLLFDFRVGFWPFYGDNSADNYVGGCHI
jgi:hypothetical protein